MASKSLNPAAPEFVPSSYKRGQSNQYHFQDNWQHFSLDPAVEESVTSEELEELEACEDWVHMMAELDEMEREHLIATALAEAEPSQILEVEMKFIAGGEDACASGKRKPESKRKGKQ